MLSDGVLFYTMAHPVNVSIQTVCLCQRKLQALTKSQEKTVLLGKIERDHTNIHVPVKEKLKERKRGLPDNLRQIALAIEDKGGIPAVLGGKGNVSASEAEKAFAGHIAESFLVYHDEGCFKNAQRRSR